MSSPEQEAEWQRQLYETRKQFVADVERAIALTSPTRRRQLYEEWRTKYGDISARGKAKFAEAHLAGTVSIDKIKAMVLAYEEQMRKEEMYGRLV